MKLQTLSLFLAYLWAENTETLMRVPLPPLCSHARFESPCRGPSEQTALHINVLLFRSYRSLSHQISMVIAALFQIDHVVWIKDRQCHQKKKSQESWEAIWSYIDPYQPPVRPCAPRPTIGRNAVQRFCRMSQKWTKDRKIALFSSIMVWWYGICGGGLALANKKNCYLLFENCIAYAAACGSRTNTHKYFWRCLANV